MRRVLIDEVDGTFSTDDIHSPMVKSKLIIRSLFSVNYDMRATSPSIKPMAFQQIHQIRTFQLSSDKLHSNQILQAPCHLMRNSYVLQQIIETRQA